VLDHAPGDRILHGRSPAPRDHRGRGRGHSDRSESEGDRGRRPVVHLGMKIPASRMRSPSGGASTPASRSRTGTSSSSHGRPGPNASRRDQVIYYHYRHNRARRGPARNRPAYRQGRAGRRRECPGQAEPVHPARRRHQDREPASSSRTSSAWPGSMATSPTWPPARTAPRSPPTS
jgi:hypothetical protein